MLSVLFAVWTPIAAALPEYWRHPRNARAAAECANLFLDDGKLKDAKFFATLAQQEEFPDPDGVLVNGRLYMREGRRFESEIERAVNAHPKKAREAAEVLLRGAADFVERGKFFDARIAISTAMKLDPSSRAIAQPWSNAVVRAKLTPRNAIQLMPLAATDRDLLIEIAHRALAMKQPNLAAFAAEQALASSSTTRRPEIARILVACANAFTNPTQREEARRIAKSVDPSLNIPAPPPIIGLGATCGVRTSPFLYGAKFDSDERFFPAATYGPPLPPRTIPADAAKREVQCRALAPPLFPEPFDAHSQGRDAEEHIFNPDEPSITELPGPCVDRSTWDIVISAGGVVESVVVLRAAFPGGNDEDAKAIEAEARTLIPVLMKQRYKPGRIRGTPVRSITRAGVIRNCV